MTPDQELIERVVARNDGINKVALTREESARFLALARLGASVNVPHTADFLEAVKLEAAHQRERWGEAHDRSKSAENWYWLIGYLAGKALRAAIEGDKEKALHHTISSAAALLNWHAAIMADESGNGRGADADLAAIEGGAAECA